MGALDDIFGTTCTKCGAYIKPNEEHDCNGAEDCVENHQHDISVYEDGKGWCNTCDSPVKRDGEAGWELDQSRL